MANLAMNLYMGMKYEDIVDASPFVFPTTRTIQRHRSKVSTHEGTNPKVYARVTEMAGFTTDADKQIHWLFDKVKLMNGVMWCARNDEFWGFCCGTKGSVEDLKEMLVELLCEIVMVPPPLLLLPRQAPVVPPDGKVFTAISVVSQESFWDYSIWRVLLQQRQSRWERNYETVSTGL
jgi:hypothetical protein